MEVYSWCYEWSACENTDAIASFVHLEIVA
jgi:hypothetical protein